jgi:hypothetical protein
VIDPALHYLVLLEDPLNAAITWPQGLNGEEDDLAVAAQVYGDVIRSSMP